MSNESHILCLGLDLEPAFKKQINNYDDFIYDLSESIKTTNKKNVLGERYANQIQKIARKLNIKWIGGGLENSINVINARDISYSKNNKHKKTKTDKIVWIDDIKKDIMKSN